MTFVIWAFPDCLTQLSFGAPRLCGTVLERNEILVGEELEIDERAICSELCPDRRSKIQDAETNGIYFR